MLGTRNHVSLFIILYVCEEKDKKLEEPKSNQRPKLRQNNADSDLSGTEAGTHSEATRKQHSLHSCPVCTHLASIPEKLPHVHTHTRNLDYSGMSPQCVCRRSIGDNHCPSERKRIQQSEGNLENEAKNLRPLPLQWRWIWRSIDQKRSPSWIFGSSAWRDFQWTDVQIPGGQLDTGARTHSTSELLPLMASSKCEANAEPAAPGASSRWLKSAADMSCSSSTFTFKWRLYWTENSDREYWENVLL